MAMPDYSRYSMLELLECLDTIDKEKWPERYQAITQCIENKKNTNDSNAKLVHDTSIFSDYCTDLEYELRDSLEVDVISFLRPFVSGLKNTYPQALEDAHCPLCSSKLAVRKAFLGWKVTCKSCQLEHKIWQTGSG